MAKQTKNPTYVAPVAEIAAREPALAAQAKREARGVPRQAFTVERVPGGWSFVTLTLDGDKVVSVERSVPDLKVMVIEKFKIAGFKYWSSL